jgi:TusA-related sulfurtransferase
VSGSIVKVIATDPASERDFKVFSEQSGVRLLSSEKSADKFIYRLQKP